MTVSQLLVTLAGVVAIAVLARFFFRRRPAAETVPVEGAQEVRITVKGGYSPDAVRARAGVPLRMVFDRQEDGDCSARVVFPELAVSHWLAPYETTVVELTLDRPGTFGFACGMNMIHGTLLVEGDPPAEVPAAPAVTSTNPAGVAGLSCRQSPHKEAAMQQNRMGLAHPPHRLARPRPSRRRHEQPHHPGDGRRVRLLDARHDRAKPRADRRA